MKVVRGMIDADKLKPGPIRRETLSAEQVERIRRFSEILGDTESVDEHIAGFCRDVTPSYEIGIWEAAAKVVSDFSSQLTTPELRHEAGYFLIVSTLSPQPTTMLPKELRDSLLKAFVEYLASDEHLDAQEENVISDWNRAGLESEFSDYYKVRLDEIDKKRKKQS